MIDQTYDPIMNEYCINDVRIILTDRNGLSILRNVRLSLEQRYYELERDQSVLLDISTKLPLLSPFVHAVEGRDGGSQLQLRSSEHCPYCKEYSQDNRHQATTT